MAMENDFILTAAQRATSLGLDADGIAEVDPRAIDNATPGAGINLNDAASGVAAGAVVTLSGGKYVLPKKIVDDPLYAANCPALITFLLTLPWCSVEPDTIFAPVNYN
jgi:hypothetical protein